MFRFKKKTLRKYYTMLILSNWVFRKLSIGLVKTMMLDIEYSSFFTVFIIVTVVNRKHN